MEKREGWGCPDSHPPRAAGEFLIIPGSHQESAECWAAFLRSPGEVEELRARRGIEPFSAHLIGGVTRPMDLVAEAGFEVESGARTMASLPNKVRMLVNLKLSEESARRDHETEKRKESRNVSQ